MTNPVFGPDPHRAVLPELLDSRERSGAKAYPIEPGVPDYRERDEVHGPGPFESVSVKIEYTLDEIRAALGQPHGVRRRILLAEQGRLRENPLADLPREAHR